MTTDTVREVEREVPVIGEYDVTVCGGGPAGCAAAIASARQGASTLLIEQGGFLGGSPAAQFVTSVLTTNGVDCQGVWHELMHELRRLDGVAGLVPHPKPMAEYILAGAVDPEGIRHAWDALISEAGVDVLHFCLTCGTIGVEAVSGVIFESPGGRQAVRSRRVIDCTGDGRVCAAAGVPWEQGADGEIYAQACGFGGYLGGIEDLTSGDVDGARSFPHGRVPSVCGHLYEVDPLNPADLTRAVREGRQRHWEHVQRLCASDAKYLNAYLQSTAPFLAVRSSRRVEGIARVTEEDVWEFRRYEDGIAKGSWDIDIYDPHEYQGYSVPRHTPSYQQRIERMRAGDYYDIRYGAIVVAEVDNLLVAGRCMSADHVAQSSLRIQQTCMSTGQAAGTAAALSLKDGVTPREMDPAVVIAQLEKDRDVEPGFDELRR